MSRAKRSKPARAAKAAAAPAGTVATPSTKVGLEGVFERVGDDRTALEVLVALTEKHDPSKPLGDDALERLAKADVAGRWAASDAGGDSSFTLVGRMARELIEWRGRYERECAERIGRAAVPPPRQADHLDPAVVSGRRFVERTVARVLGLKRSDELQFLFEDVAKELSAEEQAFALLAIARAAEDVPSTLAKLVACSAHICGEDEKVDPTYLAEAALIRLGVTPDRATQLVENLPRTE